MGYAHIINLYRPDGREILLFRECWALEKIHGSSAHISWNGMEVTFFSGGEKHSNFIKLFNEEELKNKFRELTTESKVTVYGEVYGGKCQGMSKTYGLELKFVAFDVLIGNHWLDIPKAESFSKSLGLDFVHYVKISTDMEAIDFERDAPSVQAIKNGISRIVTPEEDPLAVYYPPIGYISNPKLREGVVLRPLIELSKNNRARIVCKHKRDEFRETKSPTSIVDPEKIKLIEDAKTIAEEWVTLNRLKNIFSHWDPDDIKIENMAKLIAAMIEDIHREAAENAIFNKEVDKQIGKHTAQLFNKYLADAIAPPSTALLG